MLLKIRFHGRGGHGVKTAARIVGTAAFRAGHQVQDSPMYGAERRGAAVSASVRMSDKPVLERGPVTDPDLIVLADETLLRDASAGVLRGQETVSAILINTPLAVWPPTEAAIQPHVIGCDLSGLTRRAFGRASALSAGLAAATARLTGQISRKELRQATQEELENLEVAQAIIGVKYESGFGHVIGLGVGGTRVERLREIEFRLLPLTSRDAYNLVRDSPISETCLAASGQLTPHGKAVHESLLRVSALISFIPEIRELDLNPVALFSTGDLLRVLDARAFVESSTKSTTINNVKERVAIR